MRPGDYLRLIRLAEDCLDGVRVTGENVHRGLGSHVPYSCGGVSSTGDEEVELGVQGQGKHGTEVPMVLPHNLVLLEVPAFDCLVLAAREEIWVPVADGEVSHRVDVPGQGELE